MIASMELVGMVEDNMVSLADTNLKCPVCTKLFLSKHDLIQHASTHAKSKRRSFNPAKPYKCSKCWKAFGVYERLQKHLLCHGNEEDKPLQCMVCPKRFMNNSAWMAIFPGLTLSIAVLGFNLLGDGLRDLLDPRS